LVLKFDELAPELIHARCARLEVDARRKRYAVSISGERMTRTSPASSRNG
jgi:hypothetical protein